MQENYRTHDNGRYPMTSKVYKTTEGMVNKVILGIHGFGGDKESSALEALAKTVIAHETALVAFDLPAHGNSPVEADQLTIQNCMQDILYMADTCRQEYPEAEKYLFATSFGGYLALLCAEQLTDFKIVLRAPAITMGEHILLDLLQLTPEEFKEQSSVVCGYERTMQLPYAFYEELVKYPVMHKEQSQEMLVIHGDQDDVVPHEDIREFCKIHPNMQLHVVKGADHRFKNEGEIEEVIEAACQYWGI